MNRRSSSGFTLLEALIAIVMIAIAIVVGVLGVAQTYLSNRVGQEVMHELRADVYEHLQRQSLAFFTRTRTGEVTVEAHGYQVLSKALQPPPEKYHGLQDTETRLRHRYLDLMANEETRQTFASRAKIISALRRYMDDHGFLEMETPILQPQAGGGAGHGLERRTARGPLGQHHQAEQQPDAHDPAETSPHTPASNEPPGPVEHAADEYTREPQHPRPPHIDPQTLAARPPANDPDRQSHPEYTV